MPTHRKNPLKLSTPPSPPSTTPSQRLTQTNSPETLAFVRGCLCSSCGETFRARTALLCLLLKPLHELLAFHIHQIPIVRHGRCPSAPFVLCSEIPERQLWLGLFLPFLFQQSVGAWLVMLMGLSNTDLDGENHDCFFLLVSEDAIQNWILEVFRGKIPCQAISRNLLFVVIFLDCSRRVCSEWRASKKNAPASQKQFPQRQDCKATACDTALNDVVGPRDLIRIDHTKREAFFQALGKERK